MSSRDPRRSISVRGSSYRALMTYAGRSNPTRSASEIVESLLRPIIANHATEIVKLPVGHGSPVPAAVALLEDDFHMTPSPLPFNSAHLSSARARALLHPRCLKSQEKPKPPTPPQPGKDRTEQQRAEDKAQRLALIKKSAGKIGGSF